MFIKKLTKENGYTLVEMLFYIALFAIITLAVINSFITMTKSFKEITVQSDLVQSSLVMERISREVRQAYDISSISAGDLRLNSRDELGNNKTVRFLFSGSNVQFFENDVLIGDLNTPNIVVTALSFSEITTSNSVAAKINLSVRSIRDTSNRVEDFSNTVVLRGDYGI